VPVEHDYVRLGVGLPVAVHDGPGESRLDAVIDVRDAVLRHERVVVLLVIGHASGERRDMPVQVGITLLAAKAKRRFAASGPGRGCTG
jgi:hypothetical protein